MVRLGFVLDLKRVAELLDERLGRIRRQAYVGNGTIGRFARELNHLLAGEHGLADDGLGVALFAKLTQCTR